MSFPISLTKKSTNFHFLVFLSIAILLCIEAKSLILKKTKMVLYMHDCQIPTKENHNVTTVAVAGNPKTKMDILTFGTVFVIDDALTIGIERNSAEIGRGQGSYVNCALDGSVVYIMASFVFSKNSEYYGSTLEIQGSDRLFMKYRDLSVVGGTGVFRMARGWATLETVYLDLPHLGAKIRFNITIYHR